MKKSFLVALSLAIGLSFTSAPVDAATPKEVSYKTCKELNKVYKSGVSKAKETKNLVVNRKTKKKTYNSSKAHVSAKLYELNKKLDNDKDGLACEK